MVTRSKTKLHESGSARSVVAVIILAVASLNSRPAAGQEQVVSREYAIKAGVLAVLGKCIEWPANAAPAPGAPLVIGILGEDPFIEQGVNQLDRVVEMERQKGRHIVVRRFGSVEEYEFCHMLFVTHLPASARAASTDAERIEAALRAVGDATVLIIGEGAGLAQQGAAANLVFDSTSNLIRLEINPDAVARARLKLPPDLLRLKLVQIVRDPKS